MTNEGTDAPAAADLEPLWRTGDTWAVRYRVLVPSVTKTTDGQPTWQIYEWDYRVADISDDGGVEVSAHPRTRPGKPWSLRFNPSGRLRAVAPPDGEPTLLWSGPYFPPDEGWWDGIATEWPAFPVGPQPSTKEYDERVVQSIERVEGAWRIVVERTDEGAGARVTKTMEQTWERGRPWWTTMSIRMRMEFRGKVSDGLEIHGELMFPK